MTKLTHVVGLILATGLALTACKSTPAPKSTTTTHTESTTQQDTGQVNKTDVKETSTEQVDGSKQTKRTETTDKNTPPAPH